VSEQLSLLHVDPRTLAHAAGPDTSHGAARADALRKASHRAELLRAYHRATSALGHGLSTAEMADLHLAPFGLTELRRRATDLLNLGYLARLPETDGRQRPGYRLVVTAEGAEALGKVDG